MKDFDYSKEAIREQRRKNTKAHMLEKRQKALRKRNITPQEYSTEELMSYLEKQQQVKAKLSELLKNVFEAQTLYMRRALWKDVKHMVKLCNYNELTFSRLKAIYKNCVENEDMTYTRYVINDVVYFALGKKKNHIMREALSQMKKFDNKKAA